jgi:peptidoglycan hydrolase-like protein with peptidoglycan-binding domain
VSAVQHNLKYAYHYKISVDGYFGAKMVAVVKAFQKKFKLTQDGIVGPNTWNALVVDET